VTPVADIWVYKSDGTRQCGKGTEISLKAMRQQLEKLIGQKEVLNAEKRHLPTYVSQLCGMPTGHVNAYEVTPQGASILFEGFVGKEGFKLWVWPTPKPRARDLEAGGEDPFPLALADNGDDLFPWPWLRQNGEQSNVKNMVRLIKQMSSPDMNPVLVRELIGKPCRVLRPGDVGTSDFQPWRVNIRLDENGTIDEITFG
jgi:hypothetical protein